jgi:hypothetical protein
MVSIRKLRSEQAQPPTTVPQAQTQIQTQHAAGVVRDPLTGAAFCYCADVVDVHSPKPGSVGG